MFNLLKIEFYKLKRSKTFYFMVILNILQATAIYLLSINLSKMNGKETILYIMRMQNYIMLSIIIGTLAAEHIVTEFTSGYIKNLLSYGHKRASIFMAKAISYYAGILIITLIAPLPIIIINTIANGFGVPFDLNALLFLIKVVFLASLIQIAIGSISVLAAFAIRNFAVTVGVVVSVDFANRVLDATATIKYKELNFIYDKIVFSQMGLVFNNLSPVAIFQAIIISILTLFAATSLGIYIFNKADIK